MRAAVTSWASWPANRCPITASSAPSTSAMGAVPARWALTRPARCPSRAVSPAGRMSERRAPAGQPTSCSTSSAWARMAGRSGSRASSIRTARSRASAARARAWAGFTAAPPTKRSTRVRAAIWSSSSAVGVTGHSTSIASPSDTTAVGVVCAASSASRACGPRASAAQSVRCRRSVSSAAAHADRPGRVVSTSTSRSVSQSVGTGWPSTRASSHPSASSAVRVPDAAAGQPRSGRRSSSAPAAQRPRRRSPASRACAPVMPMTAFQSSGSSIRRPAAHTRTASPRSRSGRSVRMTR